MEQTTQYLKNFSEWRNERAKLILDKGDPETLDEFTYLVPSQNSDKKYKVTHLDSYSCFGFDVLSCRQLNMENLPSDVIRKMLSKEIEEIMKYDRVLGGFNYSAEQEFWDGINLTRAFLENVNVTEGLSPYQAIQWANHREQQKDFDLLNKYILETAYDENALLNFINNEKEKWAVFYKTKIMPTAEVV